MFMREFSLYFSFLVLSLYGLGINAGLREYIRKYSLRFYFLDGLVENAIISSLSFVEVTRKPSEFGAFFWKVIYH